MNNPIKCTDCATWWRGNEHKCTPTTSTTTAPSTATFTVTTPKPKYEQLEFEYEYEPKTIEETFKSKLKKPHEHKADLKGEYVTVICYSCNFYGKMIVSHGCFARKEKRIAEIKKNKNFNYGLNKDHNHGTYEPPKWNA